MGLDEAVTDGVGGGFGARGDPELGEDMRDMGGHGSAFDEEGGGDLSIRATDGN